MSKYGVISCGAVLWFLAGVPALADEVSAEEKATQALRRLGGDVQVDDMIPGKPVVAVRLEFNKGVTDADLEHLRHFRKLRSLSLWETSVTDKGLACLGERTELRKLVLMNTKITDAGLKHLRGLTRLEELLLNHTRVTSSGVAS